MPLLHRPLIHFHHCFPAYEAGGYHNLHNFNFDNGTGHLRITNCRTDVDNANYNAGSPNGSLYTIIKVSGYGSGFSFYGQGLSCDVQATGASFINCNNGIASLTFFASDFQAESGVIVDCGTSGLAQLSVNSSTKKSGAEWYSNSGQVLSNV